MTTRLQDPRLSAVTRRLASAWPPPPLVSDEDLYLLSEGTHARLYEKLGAHPAREHGVDGTQFGVWAPNAEKVLVMGDFNRWSKTEHPLTRVGGSGVWGGFIAGPGVWARYKYHIVSRHGGHGVDKADPYGFRHQSAPGTASVVWDLGYDWGDERWLESRGQRQGLRSPISIYEVHLGSWRRGPEAGERRPTYREVAPQLADYVAQMGFTHVEFLPVMEHAFEGSWGHQPSGFFAPAGRYGTPQELMFLIDTLHRRGIGVILDWVPGYFDGAEQGLVLIDGTELYERTGGPGGRPPGERPGGRPPRGAFGESALSFDLGRPEVRSFLLSSALFWLEKYHADGLRVGAVASMLYDDGSGQAGQVQGGRRVNGDGVGFLRRLNEMVYREYPEVQTYAEESTAWPMVSRPTYAGGLGFGFKWDTGFAHDTLRYLSREPEERKLHHQELTFRGMYAFSENFVLPLSHDEVAAVGRSLLGRMPGDEWRRFANLRLLLAYMFFQPGKKLVFMGGEFGQGNVWRADASLDWDLVQEGNAHNGVQKLVGTLNWLYRSEPALNELDAEAGGFEWLDCNDAERSTLSWLRFGAGCGKVVLVACNFTPVPRHNVRVGAPRGGFWQEILNSDAREYGGSGQGNFGGVEAAPLPWQGQSHSLTITLPPLAAVAFGMRLG
jgi:1,4-alpha-glucan branching enzyme